MKSLRKSVKYRGVLAELAETEQNEIHTEERVYNTRGLNTNDNDTNQNPSVHYTATNEPETENIIIYNYGNQNTNRSNTYQNIRIYGIATNEPETENTNTYTLRSQNVIRSNTYQSIRIQQIATIEPETENTINQGEQNRSEETMNTNNSQHIHQMDIIFQWCNLALTYLRSADCEDPAKYALAYAVEDVRQERDPCKHLNDWFKGNFGDPVYTTRYTPEIQNRDQNASRRAKRKSEYAETQKMWKKSITRTAHTIPDGKPEANNQVSLIEQVQYWKPIIEKQNNSNSAIYRSPLRNEDSSSTVKPISCEDTEKFKPKCDTAKGADGLSPLTWSKNVPIVIKTIIMNIILFATRVPIEWSRARTVLIPKTGDPQDPSNYRPISIASVIVRHYNKILANLLYTELEPDERQRGFIRADIWSS